MPWGSKFSQLAANTDGVLGACGAVRSVEPRAQKRHAGGMPAATARRSDSATVQFIGDRPDGDSEGLEFDHEASQGLRPSACTCPVRMGQIGIAELDAARLGGGKRPACALLG